MNWLQTYPLTAFGLLLWALGILWLIPGRRPRPRQSKQPAVLITFIGIVAFCFSLAGSRSEFADEVMFWIFAIGALLSGVLMITSTNPVYAALWFALSTLSTCGLFLLQSAPFLAAATVIVYAGAVIVTFVFVIMLAQQSGKAGYDQRSNQPILATVSAFILLGAMVMAILSSSLNVSPSSPADTEITLAEGEQPPPKPGNLLSVADSKHAIGSLHGLGRSLFGDYLFAVELAGTILLVASIGAVAVAPRREQGTL